MAENLKKDSAAGGMRIESAVFTDVDFSSGSTATLDMPNMRRIEGPEDVQADAYGSGDSDSGEGRVVTPTGVSGRSVTLHEYVTGGSGGSAFNDGSTMDVDHVQVKARGY